MSPFFFLSLEDFNECVQVSVCVGQGQRQVSESRGLTGA